MRSKVSSRAFTILEILVVISVIAILIGIAVPRFKGMQDEGKIIKAKSEVKTLMMAVESYKMHSNPAIYPVHTAAFKTLQADVLTKATPQMISRVLYDPFAANATTEYSYMSDPDGRFYAFWSVKPGFDLPTRIDTDGTIYY